MDELERLNQIVCWDYRLLSFDGHRLVIAGSTDFCYYHYLEAEFAGVSYINCPTDFNHAKFRLATRTERDSIKKIVAFEPEDNVIVIDAETMGSLEMQVFFIVAQGVTVTEGMVYYYERENLKPGERIADWVGNRHQGKART